MPRHLLRLLAAVTALLFVGAACTSSGDDDDASADDESTEETTDDEATDDEATDDGDEGDDDDGDDARANALGLVEDAGFSGEGAECIVDSLDEQGIDLAGLDQSDVARPDSDLQEALALAGADCADKVVDQIPDDAFDLSDPAVRQGFITSFASTSGLSEEVAECVVDYLIDNDVDVSGLIDGSPEGQQIVQDAVATCQ